MPGAEQSTRRRRGAIAAVHPRRRHRATTARPRRSAEDGVVDLVGGQAQESLSHLLLQLLRPNGLRRRRTFLTGELKELLRHEAGSGDEVDDPSPVAEAEIEVASG